MPAAVNVSDEPSVKEMVENTVLAYGGIDVFVSCAGIVRAGDLETMTKQNFELVTAINYTGVFPLCKICQRRDEGTASVFPNVFHGYH